jgi:hypothetical protein
MPAGVVRSSSGKRDARGHDGEPGGVLRREARTARGSRKRKCLLGAPEEPKLAPNVGKVRERAGRRDAISTAVAQARCTIPTNERFPVSPLPNGDDGEVCLRVRDAARVARSFSFGKNLFENGSSVVDMPF